MTSIAIIQARMASTRLPGKILMDLSGKPILQWVVDAAKQIPGIDKVVVATSDEETDNDVETYCAEHGIDIFRGSQNNVLERLTQAATKYGADIVMRLTADCPLLDPHICGDVLQLLKRTDADYCANFEPATWPDGLDCEAMTFATLKTANENANKSSEREHVTPYIRSRQDQFKVLNVRSPMPNIAGERWTIDDEADYDFVKAITDNLKDKNTPPSYCEVLDILQAQPDLYKKRSDAQRNDGLTKSLQNEGYQSNGFNRTNEQLPRTEKTIPLAAQTFSKSKIQFPLEKSPLFVTHGRGGRTWDIDGNEYVDLVSALLPNILGYCDPDVDFAIKTQMDSGISLSMATRLETQLSDKLVETIPCAEMTRFGKNGTDATSAAIRLARAYTKRDHVIACGYHGWQDWYIGATTRNLGVPKAVCDMTHKAPFNDLDTLKSVFEDYKGEVAALILEPAGAEEPHEGYLEAVKELCHAHGAVLVFDEIITGYRFHVGGAQAYYGVTPDLASFGKAMGNGMPISAIVGKAEIMTLMEDIFFSGTFGGETLSLAASLAVINKMEREPVLETIWKTGEKMANQTEALIKAHGLEDVISLKGTPAWKILALSDHKNASANAIKTMLLIEMLRNGVLIGASHNICYAHNDADLLVVNQAYDIAFKRIAEELDTGKLEDHLETSVIQPVFSVRSAA